MLTRNYRRLFVSALAIVAVVLGSTGLAGCGKGSRKNVKIEGVDGPYVNFVDNKFTLSVVIRNLEIDFGASYPIPNMPSSYMQVGPDFQTNGYMIGIGIDIGDLVKLAGDDNIGILDPTALPGGRPLPGVVAGELPGFAAELPKLRNVAFYVGQDLFGVFVPVRLPIKDLIVTHRFYDGSGARIGNISVVGQDANKENSGFLLLINLKGRVGQIIAAHQAGLLR